MSSDFLLVITLQMHCEDRRDQAHIRGLTTPGVAIPEQIREHCAKLQEVFEFWPCEMKNIKVDLQATPCP